MDKQPFGALAAVSTFSEWMRRIRKPINWIYCSAVLFPLAFALVASVILALRGHANTSGHLWNGLFAYFYAILMVMLASAVLTVLPTLLIWLFIIRFRPSLDENKAARYLGLLALLSIALFSHSQVNARPFSLTWLAILALAVMLPRLALPSLRDGLNRR
jgi:hypothetical protein